MTVNFAAHTPRALVTAIRFALVALSPLLCVVAPRAVAQAQVTQHAFDVPAGPLGSTLTRIAEQAGVAVMFEPSLTAGHTAPSCAAR